MFTARLNVLKSAYGYSGCKNYTISTKNVSDSN